ncbi:hypothetical protein BGZ47_000719 [Haplosporangium gracile]|nr:hypothetical protein BGZ47_000719 [Haplosporangium gracile]
MWHNRWTVYDGKPEDRATTHRQEAIAQHLNEQNPNYRFKVEQSDSEFFAEVTWDHGPASSIKAVVPQYAFHPHPQSRSPTMVRQSGGVRFNPSIKKPAATVSAKDQQQQRVQEVPKGSSAKDDNRGVLEFESVRSNPFSIKKPAATKEQIKIQEVPRGSPKKNEGRDVPETNGRDDGSGHDKVGRDSGVCVGAEINKTVSEGPRRSLRTRRPNRRD